MGLSPTARGASPAIAQAPKGILDPSTGKPVGANDPFFLEVNHELSDKGFFVAATDCSGPASRGRTASAARPSSEPGSLVTAIVNAPRVRALATYSSTSGVRPDCESASTTERETSTSAS